MNERRLRILWIDDPFRCKTIETYWNIAREGQIDLKVATSTEEALEKLSQSFDVLVCHIKYDENKVASYANRRHENILAIGISGGGLSDYMVKPLGYDLFVEQTMLRSSFCGVDDALVMRGLLENVRE